MLRSKVRGLGLVAVLVAAANLVAIAPAAAAGTGSISGRVSDASGNPSVSTQVFVSSRTGDSFGYARTGPDGRYTVANLKPTTFTIQFTTSWQGVHSAPSTVDVVADATTAFDYTLPATGALSGRLTRADGSPATGFEVTAGYHQRTTTDANGDWRIDPVFAGDTTVSFSHWQEHVQQYAYGKLDQSAASVITVAPGQTTVVNDSILPTGSLRITAVDSITGAPIPEFFAYIRMIGGSAQDGAVVLTGIPVGTHNLGISLAHYVDQDIKQVTVAAGQQTEVQVRLVPEALIQATVVDAATGQPLAGICVAAVSTARIPSEGCGPVSDAEGKVTVDYLPAGEYKLLAGSSWETPGYGAQWVGANGGTGRRHKAVTVSVQAGQTATGPVIRMDRAGTITGTVTKADGSRPLSYGTVVGLLPIVYFTGETPPFSSSVDENDRYTLDFLGPYDWELFFSETTEASQWSGGVANPLLADTTRVTVGQVAAYNFRFRAAVRVTVSYSGLPAGLDVASANLATGIALAHGTAAPNQVTLLLVGPQFVRFSAGGQEFDRTFWIPASGSKSFQLAF